MALNHHYATISEMSALVRERRVSPVDLVEECLERIERLNPVLTAFITVTADQARAEATRAEREVRNGHWRGPLHGIPVAAKDFFDTAGVRTTAAFGPLAQRVPAKDAEAVARFKAAGAILVGKTNMHELGMGTTSTQSHFGAVHNPWSPRYVPGGSSGGSAAAVAVGLCFATLDTDAIGSCRLPAALCGVTGLKPSYGLISTKGILAGEEGADELTLRLSHGALQCRSVEDAALVLTVLASPRVGGNDGREDYRSAFGQLPSPRIGVVTNYRASDPVRAPFGKAVETLRAFAHKTIELEAPLAAPFSIAHIDRDRRTISKRLFATVDVLVLPTVTDGAPMIEHAQANAQAVSAESTYFCNYYALPAISVPCGFDDHGVPLGLQIVGPTRGEGAVLDVAHRFQQATAWHDQHPPL